MTISTPYLVQRGTIRKDMTNIEPLSYAVSMDYMGSSEFEWGALPESLRLMQRNVDDLKMTLTDKITLNGQPLRVLHFLSPKEWSTYEGYLLRMRGDDLRLKETSGFEADRSSYLDKIDFWWDLVNGVMWSFDKHFMKHRLLDHLVASWKHMDAAREARTATAG